MKNSALNFPFLSRFFHWVMAALILAMLCIGLYIAHVSTAHYHTLLTLHQITGVSLVVLVVLRLINRFSTAHPALPTDLPPLIKAGAILSQIALYGLMAAQPLVGWGMLSAGGYPISFGGITLPPLLPHNAALWAALRQTHTLLAIALIVVILLHIAAALMHGLIRRDHVLSSMLGLNK